MFFRAVTTLCLIALPVVFSYSSGAPEGACQSMTPQHGVPPQSSPVPYTLALSSKAIRAGEQVQLEIKGNTPQHTIKGFLVQARVGDQPIGRFQVAANDKFVQVINCGNGQGNAVTHKKIIGNGPQSIRLTWIAPPKTSEDVKFYATVALNGGTFWVNKLIEPVSVL